MEELTPQMVVWRRARPWLLPVAVGIALLPAAVLSVFLTMRMRKVPPPPRPALVVMASSCHQALDVTVSLAAVRRALEEENRTFTRGARVVPAVRDGEMVGVKVYAIRPGSSFNLLGIFNGDTVERVAGTPLPSGMQTLGIALHLLGSRPGRFTIDLTRRGCPVTLDVAVL